MLKYLMKIVIHIYLVLILIELNEYYAYFNIKILVKYYNC